MTKDNKKSEVEKLNAEIERLKEELKKRKKYGLVWEDKPEDVVEMCKEKLPVLKEVKNKEIITDKNKPVNLLIEGDNYHALSVLNYTHAKKVDVIYIDPPYNTGARDWKYNNDYVDSEDPYRHSKWLSFMNHRLLLAKNLLKDDGIICVTIDDYEMPRLWALMEEIFGPQNHLGTVTIRNYPSGRKTKRKVAQIHEYALFFGRYKSSIKNIAKELEEKSHKYVQDKDGSWYCPTNLRKQGIDSTAIKKDGKLSDRFYPIYYNPKTGEISSKKKFDIKILPIDPRGEKRIWRRGKEAIDEMYEKGDLWIQKTKYGPQVYFKFRGGLNGEPPKSIWYDSKFSASEYGTSILREILGQREMFQYPKSVEAVEECIRVSSDRKKAIILDFFAGSGTTAQAVLNLNKQDDGNRQFILCTNNENNICTDVCYPRIKKVIEGYKNLKGEWVEGLGGNLKYFKTDFVDYDEPTDKNKIKLTRQATEMLCVREGTFERVEDNEKFKIFKNSDHYTGIIWDQTAIPAFKKAIKDIEGKFSVYVFSLGDEAFDDEFKDVKQKVQLSPIPEAILRVYRRIFR
jgi:adenine-specific DNA-methyltransferase